MERSFQDSSSDRESRVLNLESEHLPTESISDSKNNHGSKSLALVKVPRLSERF
jgi:hypothetical protein